MVLPTDPWLDGYETQRENSSVPPVPRPTSTIVASGNTGTTSVVGLPPSSAPSALRASLEKKTY